MAIQFNEELRNNRGQLIVEPYQDDDGKQLHRSITIGAVIYSVFMETTAESAPGGFEDQQRMYSTACRIDEEIRSDDPQPIELEPMELGDIQRVLQAAPRLATQIKAPAVELFKRLVSEQVPESKEEQPEPPEPDPTEDVSG